MRSCRVVLQRQLRTRLPQLQLPHSLLFPLTTSSFILVLLKLICILPAMV